MSQGKLLNSEEATFLAVFTATQSVIGCILNGVVLFYFLFTRRTLKTTSDKLILNLAVADFVALSTYVPWRSYLLNLRVRTKNAMFYTSLFVVCIFVTGNAILLIGFDRFIAVVWPLRYKVLITSRVFWISVIISWMSAILLGIVHGLSYEFPFHDEYELFLCALSFAQLIVLSIIYAKLLRTVRIQTGRILRQFQSVTTEPEQNIDRNSLKKTVCTTFIIVCLFYASFIPYAVYRVVSTANESLSDDGKRVTWRWIMAFTFLNSCFDPVVYFFGMKKYRARFRQQFSFNSVHGNESVEELSLNKATTREASSNFE